MRQWCRTYVFSSICSSSSARFFLPLETSHHLRFLRQKAIGRWLPFMTTTLGPSALSPTVRSAAFRLFVSALLPNVPQSLPTLIDPFSHPPYPQSPNTRASCRAISQAAHGPHFDFFQPTPGLVTFRGSSAPAIADGFAFEARPPARSDQVRPKTIWKHSSVFKNSSNRSRQTQNYGVVS